MNKIKDIFYDKNDILVALLIVAIAAIVILLKVNSIMTYPETLVAEMKDSTHEEVNYSSSEDFQAPEDGQNEGTAGDTQGDTQQEGMSNNEEPDMYSVYINYGETTYSVGQKLTDIGLVDSPEIFVQLVESSGAATKIQSGNFIIPANATPEEVIGYLTRY